MSGNYWIKLYTEILHDPKMGRMEDHLWRRTIELFCMAGDLHADGKLPCVQDMSYTLRVDEEQLETELIELQKFGIVVFDDGVWIVRKFAERQAPSASTERVRRYRERQEALHSNVTCNVLDTETDTDKIRTDTESDKETEVSFNSDIINLYSKYIGTITPIMEEILIRADKEYEPAWMPKAFEIATGGGHKRWDYVEGILKNWKATGYHPGRNGKSKVVDRTSEEARRKYAEAPR